MAIIDKVISVQKRKSLKGKGVFYISTVRLTDGSEASGIGLFTPGEEVRNWFDMQYGKSKVAKY